MCIRDRYSTPKKFVYKIAKKINTPKKSLENPDDISQYLYKRIHQFRTLKVSALSLIHISTKNIKVPIRLYNKTISIFIAIGILLLPAPCIPTHFFKSMLCLKTKLLACFGRICIAAVSYTHLDVYKRQS